MSASQVKSLLRPPVLSTSHVLAKDIVDSHFNSIDDLGSLEGLVEEAQSRYENLLLTVRVHHAFGCNYI